MAARWLRGQGAGEEADDGGPQAAAHHQTGLGALLVQGGQAGAPKRIQQWMEDVYDLWHVYEEI